MNLGITGATGQLGQLVVKALQSQARTPESTADNIVAMVRQPAKAASLGVPAREADYNRPETLERAFAGIDTLLLISSNELGGRAAQHRNVIAAARRTGVSRLVYTSLLHADHSTLNLTPEHLVTEDDLRASGLPFTILRNGWYTENYTASIPTALANGAFLGAAGDGRISSAPRADYAAAAAIVLGTPGHEGRTYELAGDTSYTLADLAAELSRQTGRQIPYRNLSESEYATVLLSAGFPELYARGFASWDVSASRGDLYDDSHHLSQLLNRPTTPLSESITQALKP